MVKKYIVIRCHSIGEIECIVSNHMEEGYICTGGICFVVSNLGPAYLQAMILNK